MARRESAPGRVKNTMSGEFIDSNVLVYPHNQTVGINRDIAIELLPRLVQTRQCRLSVQVLMEFVVVVTRKIPDPLDIDKVMDIVKDMSAWRYFSPRVEDILAALQISKKYKIHFWDAMIVRAAVSMEASVIWSEDLNHGKVYEGIPVKNPFI